MCACICSFRSIIGRDIPDFKEHLLRFIYAMPLVSGTYSIEYYGVQGTFSMVHSVWGTGYIQYGCSMGYRVHSVWGTGYIQYGVQGTFSVRYRAHSVWGAGYLQFGGIDASVWCLMLQYGVSY